MIDTIIEGKDVIGFSPWGKIDLATRCLEGVWFVSTPSHGGFWLSEDRSSQLPESLIKTNFLKSSTWWEQDCDGFKVAQFFGLKPHFEIVGPVR
jgi:hypothetical protein